MSDVLKKSVDKKIHIEALRILAILFVVFNHTGTKGYMLFSQCQLGSIPFYCYLYISIFCKFAVPIFLAISGALILGREEEKLGIVWKKRIVKIVITLLVFSVIYYCADTYLNNVEVDLGTFAKQLYSANLKYHLWYLYAYIAFLMSSPFLRNMVKNLENKYFYYMIGISIFLNLLRFVEYFIWKGQLGINVWLKTPWMVGTIVIYPCVGYFVEHRVSVDVLSRKIPFMWLITILGNALSCYATYFMGTVSGDFTSQAFHESFSLVNCITIYLTVKYIFSYVKLKPVLERSICSLGACTFGIYLLHPLIKDTKIFLKLQGMIAGTGMNAMAAIWIFILTVVICCWIVTWVLRRIPGVRYVIGG